MLDWAAAVVDEGDVRESLPPANSPDSEPAGSPAADTPDISVIVLNYNGMQWITRCISSLQAQTIRSRIEILVADNASQDGSDRLAQELLGGNADQRFIAHGENLGFCEGNNRAARHARGRFLLFLNNDTWLEPDCLARLLEEVNQWQADAGTPVMLDYGTDDIQSSGGGGFDCFGLLSQRTPAGETTELFVVGGCSYLVRRQLFERLGGFDAAFFMYAEEYDLSWRLWLSGARALLVPAARLHHRGAADLVSRESFSTSDSKRYYTNRNSLLVVMKNAQHVLLLLVPLQLLLLATEAIVSLVIVRRWSYLKRAYLDSVLDCWQMRNHIRSERRRIALLRRRGDFWMMRFLRLRPNRWDLFLMLRRLGIPQVTPR